MDLDGNGTIEYREFLRGVCNKENLFTENNLKIVFDLIDKDHKGYINSDDIKEFNLGGGIKLNGKILEDYMNQFGMRINDVLYFKDFLYIMKNNTTFNSEVSYSPEDLNTASTTDDLLNMKCNELTNLFENGKIYEENDILPLKCVSTNRIRSNTAETLRSSKIFGAFMKKKEIDKINKFSINSNFSDKICENDDDEKVDDSNNSINVNNSISRNSIVIHNDNEEEKKSEIDFEDSSD